ncbi:MAG: hypothetical protein FWF44_10095 [Defluviitaleaceae bacterium]|nr:hypothetical protein [Defluviitaleaceae bacterium]
MVIYYSKSGKTKVFAEELSKIVKKSLFDLAEKRPHVGIIGSVIGGWESLRKKESEVKYLPDFKGVKKVYVCTPIWAGQMAPSVRYLMNHAKWAGIEVNVLTTCRSVSSCQKYADSILDAFAAKGCVRGKAYGFVTAGKTPIDRQAIKEQMEQMITK